jgi:hypothetical protein
MRNRGVRLLRALVDDVTSSFALRHLPTRKGYLKEH